MISKMRLLAAFVAASASLSAMASDGVINFNGEIVDTTCTINASGVTSPVAQMVILPKVSARALSTPGVTAGRTNFTIELSDCSSSTQSVTAFFEAGPTVDPASGFLMNAGTADAVQLRLLNAAGAHIRPGDASQRDAANLLPLSNGAISLPYAVEYISTGTATAGTVYSGVIYSLHYQ